MSVYKIRAHHGMCLPFFRGEGYSGAFVENMTRMKKILEVNRQYLQHDYYTDIITFDYTEGNKISGDLFISLDTVKTNSDTFHTPYNEELHRTIIHGILHLCGINDKAPGEREIMEANENKALSILPEECKGI